MNIRKVSALTGALVLSGAVMAQHAINFDDGSGLIGANSDQSVGWQFDVNTAVFATHLAWHDDGGDGLVARHEVGIWDSGGTLLTSAIIPAGTVATLDGIWRVVDIPDVLLAVGSGYIVGGYNGSTSDVMRYDVDNHVVDSRLDFVDATFSGINGIFERPTSFSVADTGFYGPSFKLDAVPEPATMAALGLGVAAMLRRRRRA